MKKLTVVISALLVFVTFGFANENWGENIDWKKAFYCYLAQSDEVLSENQENYLLYNFYSEDYKNYHNDEFEWEEVKGKDMNEIYSSIESYKDLSEKNFYMVTKVSFEKYDFTNKGFPIDFPIGTFFTLKRSPNFACYEDYDSVFDLALFFNDLSEYNLFPMEKEEAKAFQNKRKNSNGHIDRNILLVIHYNISDFSTESYKNVKKQFTSSGYEPILGNITSIDIFDTKNNKIGSLIKK